VTVVSPSGNEFGLLLVMVTAKMSLAVAVPIETLAFILVISDGTVRDGFVVSLIVIFWFCNWLLPDPSVAFQVTIVSPSENVPVELFVMIGVTPELSVAAAVPMVTGVSTAVASVLMSAGNDATVNVGFVESPSVTV